MSAVRRRLSRSEIMERLLKRDGNICQYPGCNNVLDWKAKGPREVTIDHWVPIAWAAKMGWSDDRLWGLDNLRLMEKSCNASKGDRLPLEDGTLPPKRERSLRYRRDKRAHRRSAPCPDCDNGHNLFVGEHCPSCGGIAQHFPKSAKVMAMECDHGLTWCWACSIGVTPREDGLLLGH